MPDLRVGVVGMGHIGRRHAASIGCGNVPGMCLRAVVTSRPEQCCSWKGIAPAVYSTLEELLRQAHTVDVLLVCTPHPQHVEVALAALAAGIHVLVEKPIAADLADATRLICFHAEQCPQLQLGVFYNNRLAAHYRQVHSMLRSGVIGRLLRGHWTMTDWYRDQFYYDMSSWRGSWEGEGGGVLLNQCSHHIDLLAWWLGRPDGVRGFCQFGKGHVIEVEDAVTLHISYPDQFNMVFTASTCEKHGFNRLELVGEDGVLIVEGDQVEVRRKVGREEGREQVCIERIPIPEDDVYGGSTHDELLTNFGQAVRGAAPLIVPAEEAVQSLELIHAALLSHGRGGAVVALPLEPEAASVELHTYKSRWKSDFAKKNR